MERYEKLCALTFDDGPSDVTPMFLDILEKYNVIASFFVVGNNLVKETEYIVRRAHAMGCEINNHSLTHSVMSRMKPDAIRSETEKTSAMIEKITGEPPKFFRPPYIAVSDVMYDNIDLPFICGYGAKDWEPNVTADMRAESILSQAEDGCIFLLHDAMGNIPTAKALERIIPSLLEQGYGFVTVSELFAEKNITPEKGVLYSSVYRTE